MCKKYKNSLFFKDIIKQLSPIFSTSLVTERLNIYDIDAKKYIRKIVFAFMDTILEN